MEVSIVTFENMMGRRVCRREMQVEANAVKSESATESSRSASLELDHDRRDRCRLARLWEMSCTSSRGRFIKGDGLLVLGLHLSRRPSESAEVASRKESRNCSMRYLSI